MGGGSSSSVSACALKAIVMATSDAAIAMLRISPRHALRIPAKSYAARGAHRVALRNIRLTRTVASTATALVRRPWSVTAVAAERLDVAGVAAEGAHRVARIAAERLDVAGVTAEGAHRVAGVAAERLDVAGVAAERAHRVASVAAEGAHHVASVAAEGAGHVTCVVAVHVIVA